MATTRFETTMHAIQGGLKNFTVEKGIQNIEGWEEYLSKHDHEGVKKVVQDLGKLKKLLQAKEIDSDQVKTLLLVFLEDDPSESQSPVTCSCTERFDAFVRGAIALVENV